MYNIVQVVYIVISAVVLTKPRSHLIIRTNMTELTSSNQMRVLSVYSVDWITRIPRRSFVTLFKSLFMHTQVLGQQRRKNTKLSIQRNSVRVILQFSQLDELLKMKLHSRSSVLLVQTLIPECKNPASCFCARMSIFLQLFLSCNPTS